MFKRQQRAVVTAEAKKAEEALKKKEEALKKKEAASSLRARRWNHGIGLRRPDRRVPHHHHQLPGAFSTNETTEL
eukprot:SAG22_NODE_125_length_18883_cov_12.351629_10_plen_75_part_00